MFQKMLPFMVFILTISQVVGVSVTKDPRWVLSGNYNPAQAGNSDNIIDAMNSNRRGYDVPMNGAALTVALDVVQAWAVILTLGFTLIIFIFLAFCVCSRKDNSYDEFETSHGITTVKILTDTESHRINLSPKSVRSDHHSELSSSRCALQRELPAIPTNSPDDQQASKQSKLVSHKVESPVAQQGSGAVKLVGGVQVLPSQSMIPSANAPTSSTSKQYQSNVEKRDKPYNPYSQISNIKTNRSAATIEKVEQEPLQATCKTYEIKPSVFRDVAVTQAQASKPMSFSSQIPGVKAFQPFYMPQQRKEPKNEDPEYQTVLEHQTPAAANEPAANIIPAAMAISGRTPANEEMPYMTPRSLQGPNEEVGQQQVNFSGDSQDSRGYTSISVREPLAELKSRQAEQKPPTESNRPAPKPEAEGYYMTVSDDSADETYACIYEGSQRDDNNTYAQIMAAPSATQQLIGSANMDSSLSARDTTDTSPPAPPSVDSLKHFVHSRQASSSSAASAGVSSPVTEKKGPRCQLPSVAQGEPDMYSMDEPVIKPYVPVTEKAMPQSLEEMYAKVNKKRPDHSQGNSMEVYFDSSSAEKLTRSRENIASPGPLKSPQEFSSIAAEVVCDAPIASAHINETSQSDKSYYTQSSDPGYETVKTEQSGDEVESSFDIESEPGYETLKQKTVEPGYETVSDSKSCRSSMIPDPIEPSYETVCESVSMGYQTVRSDTGTDFDPGYEELLNRKSAPPSECDPNYEQLKFTSDDNNEPSYEVVDENFLKKFIPYKPPTPEQTTAMPIYAEVKKKTDVVKSPKTEDIVDIATTFPDIIPTETTVEDLVIPSPVQVDTTTIAQIMQPTTLPCLEKCSSSDMPRFPVIDSPVDVELPPPQFEHTDIPSLLLTGSQSIEEEEVADNVAEEELQYTLPDPPPLEQTPLIQMDADPTSESTKEITCDNSTESDNQCEALKDLDDLPPPLPGQLDHVDDLAEPFDMVPPPVLADEAAFQDLPQPLPPTEIPLADLLHDAKECEDICDLPAPPPPVFLTDDLERKESITLTVNPMANLDQLITTVSETTSTTASATNGSSVASIVTIDSTAHSDMPVSSISQSSPPASPTSSHPKADPSHTIMPL